VNAEKWQQMKQIFASALEVQEGEREAFLRNACGGDDPLVAELQAMLSVHESNQSESATPVGAVRAAGKREGQRIGPYRVIQRIGSGGMGDVYLAARADAAFNKRVAIKLVQTGVDTEQILKRFRHERQILAALDHPNIAKLLDGGTTNDGLPYFVMDYVEGTPITTYCDTHKLAIAERVRLFRDICLAVQYVHQNLVVHRDLKPSNILVTADGVPKLLDFGIAKLLKPEFFSDPMDATRIESRLMTPRYASPEQVRGEAVTTASDVYSLGVILYELLTSRRPYRLKSNTSVELLRAVCDQEPEKPSTRTFKREDSENETEQTERAVIAQLRATVPERLRRQLRGDLDMIVLKALRKEPQHRYSSAEQLSEDLQRHLEGLPVTAHRDSTRYRAGKFVRRHKAGVTAAALVVVSLIVGVLATTWQARVARSERAAAERQFNDVRKLTTSFLFEFDSAIQNLPGSTPARQLLVQRALEYLNKLAEQARGDASLQREVAEAYLKVGDVQGNPYGPNLGDSAGAVQSYRKALEISQALTRSNQRDVIATEYLARSYGSLGEVLPTLGQPTEGVADLGKAAEILESLAGSRPDDKELRFRLANSYHVLGDIQGHIGTPNLGEAADSLVSYRKALALYESLLAIDGNDTRARRGAATLQIRIGDSQAQDDLQGAMRSYQTALWTFEALVAADPNSAEDRRQLAHAYEKVGGIEELLGRNEEALQNYRKASALQEATIRVDPNNAQAAMGYVISLRYTGDLLYKMNARSAAISEYRRTLNILERLSLSEPGNVLARERYSEMLVVLGMALAESGKVAEARNMTSRGLIIAKQLASREDATPDELFAYAESFLSCDPPDLRQPTTAVEYAKRAVEKTGGVGSDYLDELAEAYFQSGDAMRAVESEEKALNSLPPDSHKRQSLEARLMKFKGAPKRK
jgi:non-specific serine/threonine protein kinase/serine/threonine-protein kinase